MGNRISAALSGLDSVLTAFPGLTPSGCASTGPSGLPGLDLKTQSLGRSGLREKCMSSAAKVPKGPADASLSC